MKAEKQRSHGHRSAEGPEAEAAGKGRRVGGVLVLECLQETVLPAVDVHDVVEVFLHDDDEVAARGKLGAAGFRGFFLFYRRYFLLVLRIAVSTVV